VTAAVGLGPPELPVGALAVLDPDGVGPPDVPLRVGRTSGGVGWTATVPGGMGVVVGGTG
jgi:hypothetical protein